VRPRESRQTNLSQEGPSPHGQCKEGAKISGLLARHHLRRFLRQHKRCNQLRLRRKRRQPPISVPWAQSRARRLLPRQRPLLRLRRRYRNLVQLLLSRTPPPYQPRRSPGEALVLHCRKPPGRRPRGFAGVHGVLGCRHTYDQGRMEGSLPTLNLSAPRHRRRRKPEAVEPG